MPAPQANPSPASRRLELAQQLFKERYASCFWNLRPDLVITEETLPLVIKGLRTHGGKEGVLAAAQLTDEAPAA
jgi:hypothetical protein